MIMRNIAKLLCGLTWVALAGCAGEAMVTYHGAAVIGDAPAHRFDATANPDKLPPLAGATVTLCVETRCKSATAGANGLWGPLEMVFGGSLVSNSHIDVKASAPGFDPVDYAIVYEGHTDPTGGEKALTFALRKSP